MSLLRTPRGQPIPTLGSLPSLTSARLLPRSLHRPASSSIQRLPAAWVFKKLLNFWRIQGIKLSGFFFLLFSKMDLNIFPMQMLIKYRNFKYNLYFFIFQNILKVQENNITTLSYQLCHALNSIFKEIKLYRYGWNISHHSTTISLVPRGHFLPSHLCVFISSKYVCTHRQYIVLFCVFISMTKWHHAINTPSVICLFHSTFY